MSRDLLRLAPAKPKQQPQSMSPTCMDVDSPADQAEQANDQDPGKSPTPARDNTAAEPGPSRMIPPDFGLFGMLPKRWKDNTASSGSAQDCPDSTSDLPGSSTKDQVNVDDSQKPDWPSDFDPDRKTYEGYKLKRKPHLEWMSWPALPQPCPNMMPHMLWSSTNSIQKPPLLQANVLQWTCHRAQELYITKGPEPSWTKEVKVWVKTLAEWCRKPFSHPLMGQAVPLMFVVRFLEASFQIPRSTNPSLPLWSLRNIVGMLSSPNQRIPMLQRSTNLTKHGPAWKLLCTREWRFTPGSIQSWHPKRRPKWHWTRDEPSLHPMMYWSSILETILLWGEHPSQSLQCHLLFLRNLSYGHPDPLLGLPRLLCQTLSTIKDSVLQRRSFDPPTGRSQRRSPYGSGSQAPGWLS